jgi:hypothetical protein
MRMGLRPDEHVVGEPLGCPTGTAGGKLRGGDRLGRGIEIQVVSLTEGTIQRRRDGDARLDRLLDGVEPIACRLVLKARC